jgi:hypothetical protein
MKIVAEYVLKEAYGLFKNNKPYYTKIDFNTGLKKSSKLTDLNAVPITEESQIWEQRYTDNLIVYDVHNNMTDNNKCTGQMYRIFIKT